jgi:3-hydroxyisobutyrate dehydrogenase-like beta-hydroxyacid dehydrogenase
MEEQCTMKIKIGFIGTGMMGEPMAGRLLDAGHELTVWNRTPEKAVRLIDRGAVRAFSVAELSRGNNIVISMIADSRALTEIVEGEKGVLVNLPSDGVHIDMSTVSPETTAYLGKAYAAQKKRFIHAPVLGSTPQAADGTLLIFAGGESDTIEMVKPVFDVLGKRIWKFDAPEKASTIKLSCNLFIASMIVTLGEGLLMVRNAGIDGAMLLEILLESSLGAPMYQTKGTSVLERKFTPRFMVNHMEKDLSLISDAARRLGVSMPALGAVHELFIAAKNKGYGMEDYSAVVKVVEEMAENR